VQQQKNLYEVKEDLSVKLQISNVSVRSDCAVSLELTHLQCLGLTASLRL